MPAFIRGLALPWLRPPAPQMLSDPYLAPLRSSGRPPPSGAGTVSSCGGLGGERSCGVQGPAFSTQPHVIPLLTLLSINTSYPHGKRSSLTRWSETRQS